MISMTRKFFFCKLYLRFIVISLSDSTSQLLRHYTNKQIRTKIHWFKSDHSGYHVVYPKLGDLQIWSLKTAYETGETFYNFILVTKRFTSPKTIMRYAGTWQNYQSRQNSQTFYLDKRKITRIQATPRRLLPTSATTIHHTSSFGIITIYGEFLFCIHRNSQYMMYICILKQRN